MNCPGEVRLAAAIALIGSGLFLLYGLFVGAMYGLLVHSVHQNYPAQDLNSIVNPIFPGLQNLLVGAMYVSVILGIAGFVTALGLLQMREWARRLTIVWCVVSSCVCLVALFPQIRPAALQYSSRGIPVLMLFLLPINAWWLMLFFRPEIRGAFRSSDSPAEKENDRNERWQRLARPRYPGDFGS
jgi:lysylphosphatidylglycerol synthetase-like protein (DUF2156 family)